MLRIVIDTDVLVSAFISPDGASRQLLLDIFDDRFRPLISTPLLLEYEAVLTRSRHMIQGGLTGEDVARFLDGLVGFCVPVVFDYRWRPTGAHKDDEMVVETAINGQADIVATFNLRHMRHVGPSLGFEAQRPGPLLRRLRE